MARAIAFINPRLTTKNVGDIFIEDSAKRILVYDRARSVDIDPRMPVTAAEIDRINACDRAVIVGTNLWYRDLRKRGRWTFTMDDLRRIRVPVIPFGIGTSRRFGEDNGFGAETLEQLHWIHGSCELASARDPRTAEALAEAGIRNVAMTGCPTLFRTFAPRWELQPLKDTGRVTVTVRDGQKLNTRVLLHRIRELGLEPIVAAQKPKDLGHRIPLPFSSEPRRLFRYEIGPYLELVRETLGAVGWRLHGNMLHLAHGNPAVFFANNSRAESFCEAFGLPCISCADGERIPEGRIFEHLDRLFDPATFAVLPVRYAAARAEMVRFLEANGLEHRLGPAVPPPQAGG
ncbi:MAG: polysaccharide pyruvyl transferase family protein [Planctomycetes bacterium]|nr:polysaccharide pyruvyl transferase family protein [Planctomycetota bacterium]